MTRSRRQLGGWLRNTARGVVADELVIDRVFVARVTREGDGYAWCLYATPERRGVEATRPKAQRAVRRALREEGEG